jgi:hypothetical protein
VGRGRGRHKRSQGRAEGRVRGRVRERVQGRSPRRGEASTGRSRGAAFDVGAIGGYADRLRGQLGGSSGLAGAASGLAGAASGLAGGSLAHRLAGGGTEGSEKDFGTEVTERLDLMDVRLARLEDEVRQLREGGDAGDVAEPAGEPEAGTHP